MILLKEKRRLTNEDINTHIKLPFFVPKEGSKLVVRFFYSPKQFEDIPESLKMIRECLKLYEPTRFYSKEELETFLPLKNMLTLSIDSPNGFVGTAHRQNSVQKHIISEKSSSRGFNKQKIVMGKWNITISVYPIISPYVDYEIEVRYE